MFPTAISAGSSLVPVRLKPPCEDPQNRNTDYSQRVQAHTKPDTREISGFPKYV